MSNAGSATIFFGQALSFSSCLSHFMVSAFIPPYRFLQKWKVASLTPSFLQIWGSESPAASLVSAWRGLQMICSGYCSVLSTFFPYGF